MPASSILAPRFTKALEPLQPGSTAAMQTTASVVAMVEREGKRESFMGLGIVPPKVGILQASKARAKTGRATLHAWQNTR